MKKWKRVLSVSMSMVLGLGSALPAMPVKAEEKASEEAVYLDEMDWEWAYAQSKGNMYGDKANLPGSVKLPKENLCFGNSKKMEMKMGDGQFQTFDRGIGTEACSEIVYKLGEDDELFEATIGFDKWVLGNKSLPSSVQFKVLGSKTTDESANYEELYVSDIVYSGKNEERPYFVPEDISVNVDGYEYMKLWVWDAGEGLDGPTNQSDTVNWANARLIQDATVTFDELQELITEADKKDKADYTEGSWTASGFEDALTQAKAVEETASEEEIKEAYRALKDAMKLLVSNAVTALKVTLDKKELNPLLEPDETAQVNVLGIKGDGTTEALAEDVTVTYKAKNLHASGAATVATVDENGVVTGIDGGVSKITATATINGKEVSGSVNLTVRPFYRKYHETMTMKMFMGQNGNVNMTFAEALETIKKIDNLTVGVPKIIYLVGWQYDGHDSGYPSWSVVNERLKRPEDATATDSLKWLMHEARKYNTTVSLHINMLDINPSSPLWDEYLEKDLIAKYEDETLRTYKWGYPICYTAEWEAGLAQRRIDQLVEMLPELVEGGTIHIDAFHTYVPQQDSKLAISPYHEMKYGWGQKADEETQRKIFKYWRDKGIDVTSETVKSYRKDNFVGLQPMAWHFSMSDQEYLEIPASLYCGGDRGKDIFGQNFTGESAIKADKENLSGFLEGFALMTLPFYYLNSFDRLSLEGNTAVFSDNVKSYKDGSGLHITKGDVVMRDGDDIFMPALWKENTILAYSKNGYTERTWKLPEEWKDVTSVDLFTVNKTGFINPIEKVDCSNGKITLSLNSDQMMMIVPTGTVEITAPGRFNLLTPAANAVEVDPENGEFTWEASERAVSYKVIVAENKEMTKNVQEKTVTDTSAAFSEFNLEKDKVYYWTVAAESETGETAQAAGTPARFVTVLTGTLVKPENVTVMRYTDDNVRVEWEETGIPYNYHVLRRVAGTEEFEGVGTTTENYFTDTTASRKEGQVYEYVVRVYGTDEYAESEILSLDHEVYLSDMEWSEAHEAKPGASWGTIHKDLNLDNKPIRMGGFVYEKGLQTHADSDITYDLNGQYQTFSATIGTDDKQVTSNAPTSIVVEVWGDEELLYSQWVDKDFVPDKVTLDVSKVQKLMLKVYTSDPSNSNDWGSFGAARLAPKVPVDKADLAELIEYAKSQQETENYKYVVPVVKEAFEKALVEAVAVNENADATQEEVDAAHDALLEMVGYLDFTGNSESLKTLVDAAKVLNEKLYTEESWGALQDALAKAEEVLADENALQAEIDKAAEALQEAMDNLAKIPVDKTKLQKLVDKSKKYEDAIAEYTPATAEIFKGALEHAREVLASDEVTQEEIDAAYTALQNAIFNLRLIPNKDKLEDLIKKAEAVDTTKYTEESVAVFTAALDNARAVFADENATEEDVKAAEKELKKAQKNLVAKADDKDNNDNNGSGSNKDDDKNAGNGNNKDEDKNNNNADTDTVKTGDSTSVWMTIVLFGAALASTVLVMRRKRS